MKILFDKLYPFLKVYILDIYCKRLYWKKKPPAEILGYFD